MLAKRLALVVTCAAVMAGCSLQGPSATPSPSPSPTASPSPTPTPRTYTYADMVVGFVQAGSESGWRAANTSSFKETAAAKGITLKFTDSQNKIENQITAFNTYIQDKTVNVIVLAAVGTTGYDDVLKQARAAGKIVIVEGWRIDADPSLYFTYVGSDFVEEGRKAAAAMCNALKGFESKHVAEIAGAADASFAIDRARGFREKMADCGIDIMLSQSAEDWSPTQAKHIMTAYLKETRNIQGVFAHNDELAIAAIAAIKEAGLVPGKDIMLVGVDATANGIKYLISGGLYADVECDPLLGPLAYNAALRGLNGDMGVPKWITPEEEVYYKDHLPDWVHYGPLY